MKSYLILSVILFFHSDLLFAKASYPQRPKLVLVIVVDQFRSDMLTRFKERFLPAHNGKNWGGFRVLMDQGAYIPFADYEALQNMTCPGHAMILTGAYPAQTGISLNEWPDSRTGKMVECAEDSELGHSPRRLKTSTVGDELKLVSKDSRIVSISLKDRSAIMLGGHSADLVFWLKENDVEWESSKYYLHEKEKPQWMSALNEKIKHWKNQEIVWKSEYSKEKFEHRFKAGSTPSLATPWAGNLTLEAASAAIDSMKLGQQKQTDLLAVSFSNHDLVGHFFGPASAEIEDATLREDRVLADLLNKLEQKIPGGLKNTLIILTADHGTAPLAEQAKSLGLDAGRIDQQQLLKKLNPLLVEKWGKLSQGDWLIGMKSLNLYLSDAAKNQKKNSLAEVEIFIREQLLKEEGVASVFSRREVLENKLVGQFYQAQILRSYVPEVNGDWIIVPKPFWYEASATVKTTHMTPYGYDRTVPLLFWGASFKPGIYAISAKVVDLAPTLSFSLGIVPPASSQGRVLGEILDLKP